MSGLSIEQLNDLSAFLLSRFGIRSFVWCHDATASAQRLHVWADPMLVIFTDQHGTLLFDQHFTDKFQTKFYRPRGSSVFLGTHTELVDTVKKIGKELEDSFKETKLHLPPWRRTRNILALYDVVFAQAADHVHLNLEYL